jgi:hypothetical protein
MAKALKSGSMMTAPRPSRTSNTVASPSTSPIGAKDQTCKSTTVPPTGGKSSHTPSTTSRTSKRTVPFQLSPTKTLRAIHLIAESLRKVVKTPIKNGLSSMLMEIRARIPAQLRKNMVSRITNHSTLDLKCQ